MTGERTPWWYSGGDDDAPAAEQSRDQADGASEAPDDSAGDDAPGGSMDWSALMAGAARMVDWATTAVMAPHAEHADPAEHPQCVVCRTILLVGDPVGLVTPRAGDADPADAPSGAATARPIRWLPIEGETEGPTT